MRASTISAIFCRYIPPIIIFPLHTHQPISQSIAHIVPMDLDSQPEECFLDLLDQPYQEVAISVVQGIPRGHGLSAYVGYVIKLRSPSLLTLQRRYSEFAALREVLLRRWPGVLIPCLPPKLPSGSNSLRVVNQRIKYLSYFVNNCAKMTHIFFSDQFQLFLTSTDPDLKTRLERLPSLPAYLMLNRYQQAFRHIRTEDGRRAELWIGLRDQVEPFKKMLQAQKIPLINFKRQVYKLALKREEYLRTSKILYADTLPALEDHLSRTAAQLTPILIGQPVKEGVAQLKELSARNYWVLYECLKLQIGESQAAIQAIQSRQSLERSQSRLLHEISVNDQQLSDLKAGKNTLRQFFATNKQQMAADLSQQNTKMRQEVEALRGVNLMAAEITVTELAQGYRKRREELWRKAWSMFANEDGDTSKFLQRFYGIFLRN